MYDLVSLELPTQLLFLPSCSSIHPSDMDQLCIDLKTLNITNFTVEEIIDNVLEITCKRKRCVNFERLLSEMEPLLLEERICLNNVLGFFTRPALSRSCNNGCVIVVYRVLFNCCKKVMGDASSKADFRKELLAVCNGCVTLPDIIFPLTNEFESINNKSVTKNASMNLRITEQCLLLYMDVLFCENEGFHWAKVSELSIVELTSLQKYIVRKSSCKLWIIIASRQGDHSWSNNRLREILDGIMACFCVLLKHSTLSSLFCGANQSESMKASLFPNGIADVVLDDICKQFTQVNWKKSATLKHALIWCVTKINHPYLGVFISKVMPAFFLMVDDYVTMNKVLGICGINYVIKNVNPADLKLYNHADVIYEVLYKQLFSSDDQLYEVTLPCLLAILCVLESKPEIVVGIEFSRFDKTIEKIFQNLDFTTRVSTRNIFLKYLPDFINEMGGNIIKHLDSILNVLIRCLEYGDGKDEVLRSHALHVLSCTIHNAWPVIPRYQNKIFKCLLKFLVDINDSSFLGNTNIKKSLEKQIFHILVSMRICCKESFDALVQEVTECSIDMRYVAVQTFLCEVLACDHAMYCDGS